MRARVGLGALLVLLVAGPLQAQGWAERLWKRRQTTTSDESGRMTGEAF